MILGNKTRLYRLPKRLEYKNFSCKKCNEKLNKENTPVFSKSNPKGKRNIYCLKCAEILNMIDKKNIKELLKNE